MFLVIDCETTGFPYWKQSAGFRGQARIMQLGALLLDNEFREVSSFGCLLKPTQDWPIVEQGAFATHGLTYEVCDKYGLPQDKVFDIFEHMANQAEFIVAHNIKFDSFMFQVELTLLGRAQYDWTSHGICTMRGSTDLCKIPKKSGGYKWPTLNELYQFCFDEERVKSHEALGDARDTACCLGWMLQKKHIDLKEFQPVILEETV